MIIIYLAIALAALCNAVMDVLQFHFHLSVFKYFNAQYWNPEISWMNKYVNNNPLMGLKKIMGITIPAVLTDAWHLFKSLMIGFLLFAIALAAQSPAELYHFVGYSITWNVVFLLFYKKILRR